MPGGQVGPGKGEGVEPYDVSIWADEASDLLARFETMPLSDLLGRARASSAERHGPLISYSRKVFIPLTHLCRDVCGYCTFARRPSEVAAPYLSPDEVLAIARAGQAAGCREALFTLGDKPELRYAAARDALQGLGFSTTREYIAYACDLVLRETGLLPHVNAGLMSQEEMAALRRVSVSQGVMLESVSTRLCARGGPHFGSPDKDPAARLAMIDAAGHERIPFTSGILIGIGETRRERIESLLGLRDLHRRHGHIQEVIVQNFRAKSDTRMAGAREPSFDDLRWTAAVARLVLGPDMNIQVPPNLSHDDFPGLLETGINDWGGISPVTADHVNPEAPWPQIDKLERATAQAGFTLVERLAVYPDYVADAGRWIDHSLLPRVLALSEADGFARAETWAPGQPDAPPPPPAPGPALRAGVSHQTSLSRILQRASAGDRLAADDIVRLFAARGREVAEVCEAADAVRAKVNGATVTYVVNRNINYTNVCSYACHFCAFSKGKTHEHLRGTPYDLDHDEIARRVTEAWDRGATEVCMQGGIHPAYTGETYLALLRTVKRAEPRMHVHAFSPLEITHGAQTLGLSVTAFLERLQAEGLGSLPGTAAEILDDDVRAVICPDKLSTRDWLDVVASAHAVGLRTTATIMFGHVEHPRSWAAHLLHIRDLQQRTGGFTEFVPLPFVHMEAPMYLKGLSRPGPTWRETLLVHAVARLVLHPLITSIQASWVKLGETGIVRALSAGVNDLGGTLMNESISRAAGTVHGQELPPERMDDLIQGAGREPMQRTTLYGPTSAEQQRRGRDAPPLSGLVLTPVRRAPRPGRADRAPHATVPSHQEPIH